MSLIPIVIEQSSRGERAFDIYSRLLRDRIIFLGTGISDEIANLIIGKVFFMGTERWSEIYKKPISEEEYKEICHNLDGFFTTLKSWDDAEQLPKP